MSVVEFDYGSLNSVIHAANSMGGVLGHYEIYRTDLKVMLYSCINEGILAGKEPMGNAYIENARTEIENKRSDLSGKKDQWNQLATNLSQFKAYVENQDKMVADEFESTSNAYTDYTGIGGFFTWMGDAFFGAVGVDFVNSNWLTRGAADWVKSKTDDLHSAAADTLDYFRHGKRRYWANIGKSILITGGAIVGTVIAFVTLPFDGGLSAPFVVAGIGAVCSGVAALLSAVNTAYTINENLKAKEYFDSDPGMARFHGDVESYADHVMKTKYGSLAEYRKHEKLARWIDGVKAGCEVTSMVTGVIGMLGTKSVIVLEDGNEVSRTVFDFSRENMKTNILKTFGFKSSTDISDVQISSNTEVTEIIGNGTGTSSVTVMENSYVTEGTYTSGLDFDVKKKTLMDVTDPNNGIEYKVRTISGKSTAYTTEYSSVVSSDASNLYVMQNKTTASVTTTNTLDYTKAMMSSDKAEELEYLEKLNKAGSNKQKERIVKNLKDAKKGMEKVKDVTESVTDSDGTTASEIAKNIVTKNKFLNSFDKYIYSIPTEEDADFSDYLKGFGGSNADKAWNLWDAVTGGT